MSKENRSLRIQVAEPINPAGLEILRQQAEVLEEPTLADLGQVDALIVRGGTQVGAADLERGRPRLKVVGRAGVGVDNLDLEACRRHDVIVVNAPTAPSNAVAEHAVGLMFALARQTPWADRRVKVGQWPKKELRGVELAGKTLGVIGMGRIGTLVAQKADALGMSVLGLDPPLAAEKVRPDIARLVSLADLLGAADFISLHVPLKEDTRAMIGASELRRAKPELRIINTARGGVIDERALLHALEIGQVAGAALDVYEDEPPGASPLVQHPRVIATPHIGAQTEEAQRRVATEIAEEVLAALDGADLRWRVA